MADAVSGSAASPASSPIANLPAQKNASDSYRVRAREGNANRSGDDKAQRNLRSDDTNSATVTGAANSDRCDAQRSSETDEDTTFESTVDDLEGENSGAPSNTGQTTQAAPVWSLATLKTSRAETNGKGESASIDAASVRRRAYTTALDIARQRHNLSDKVEDTDDVESTDEPIDTQRITLKVNSQETHWNFARLAQLSSGNSSLQQAAANGAVNAQTARSGAVEPDSSEFEIEQISGDLESTEIPPEPRAAATEPRAQRARGETSGKGEDRDANAHKLEGLLRAQGADASDDDLSVAPPSPVAQVATKIAESLMATSDSSDVAQINYPQFDVKGPAVNGQVLRTIDVTLAPAELGSVRLRLSLKDNVLAIEAEASKTSTAKMLTDDRDALEKSLKDAGYDVSAVRISGVSTDNSSSGTLGANSFTSSGQGYQDSRAAFSFGRQDSSAGGNNGSAFSNNGQRDDAPKETVSRNGAASGVNVYI